jgi:hypothetical protein
MRKREKYRAAVLVVAMVMIIPTMAAIVGYTMWGDRVFVLSEYHVLNRQKRAVKR